MNALKRCQLAGSNMASPMRWNVNDCTLRIWMVERSRSKRCSSIIENAASSNLGSEVCSPT
jgi:hypothetical protein